MKPVSGYLNPVKWALLPGKIGDCQQAGVARGSSLQQNMLQPFQSGSHGHNHDDDDDDDTIYNPKRGI